jgi:RNA polymerase sigma factor (sigma-70 family)
MIPAGGQLAAVIRAPPFAAGKLSSRKLNTSSSLKELLSGKQSPVPRSSMATANLTTFFRRLTRSVAAETLGEETDRKLVERLLTNRDDAAFEALARRHGSMVYRVCWRILQHGQDAEDAFQATFLLLARKLGTVRKHESLASWLHGVAHRAALKAKAQAATRRHHERKAATLEVAPSEDLFWNELRTVLDAELAGLPEKWRLPLILCYLEGRTQDEAAGQLKWSKSTMRRRLEEAREALGRRLTRRGVALSAALSVPLLSDCMASAAISPKLLVATVDASVRIAAGKSVLGIVSPKVTALTEGVLKTMLLTKFKIATAALILAMAGLGAAVILAQPAAEPAVTKPSVEEKPPQQPADAPAAGKKEPAPNQSKGPERPAAEPKALLERALQNAAAVKKTAQKVWVIGEIATAQASAGLKEAAEETLRRAERIVRDIENDQDPDKAPRAPQYLADIAEYRAKVAENLGKADVKAGDAKGAVERANALPAGLRQRALAAIAVAQAQAGDTKGARRTADGIRDDGWKAETLLWIATRQAETAEFEAAIETAEAVPTGADKARALAAIAACQARAGDQAGATRTFEQALKVARSGADEVGRTVRSLRERANNSALATIAGAQARAGRTEQARKTAQTAQGSLADLAWLSVALALADRGDTKGALEASAFIQKQARYEVVSDVVAAVAKKNLAEARRIADTIEDDVYQFYAHLEIAKAQSATDRPGAVAAFQDALRKAEKLKDVEGGSGDVSTYALANLAKAQAEVGEEQTALDWIDKHSSPAVKSRALWRVAEALIKQQRANRPKSEQTKDTFCGLLVLIGARTKDDPTAVLIQTMRPEGTDRRTVLRLPEGHISAGRISPSGDQLAYSYIPPKAKGQELWLLNVKGQTQKVAERAGPVMAWSPDGKQIAFCRDAEDAKDDMLPCENFVIDVTTKQQAKLALTVEYVAEDWHPTEAVRTVMYSNPRNWIYREKKKDKYPVRQLDLLTADGKKVPITKDPSFDDLHSRFSPSGDRIAYHRRRFVDGRPREYVVVSAPDGSSAKEIFAITDTSDAAKLNWLHLHGFPCWSPDGKSIACLVAKKGLAIELDLVFFPVDAGEMRRLPLKDIGLTRVQAIDWR